MKLTERKLRKMIREQISFIHEEEFDENVPYVAYAMKQSYETYDDEDLEVGEPGDRGWAIGPKPKYFDTLEELIDRVEGDWVWIEWSSSPASPGDWIVGESEIDYSTGEYERRNLFVEHEDGTPLTDEEMDYITQRLGLYGR